MATAFLSLYIAIDIAYGNSGRQFASWVLAGSTERRESRIFL
jgi:hypothetical protein